uniref:PRA1 family protein n=1 Tax=Podarcis muralis TaxID=64176 RepID=A0A670K8B7_PODMU
MPVRLPPVRALEDFLLGSSRLSPPDVRDLQRWHNRVVNNLLYYQIVLCQQLIVAVFCVDLYGNFKTR